MAKLETRIARRAQSILGRPISRGTKFWDWKAAEAVAIAACAEGLPGTLLRWAGPATSMTALARQFVARYVQGYGPVGNMIDVGGHIGSRTPIIVEVA